MKKRNLRLVQKFVLNQANLLLSDISLFELYYGASFYQNPEERRLTIDDFATRMKILPFESNAARHAAEINAALEKTHQRIGSYDTLIAGTARAQGHTVVTRNLREFSRVEGLRVENWID